MNKMILYLLPFTFQTFLLTSSISVILISYAFPSFTHGYKHITNLSISFLVIYLTVLTFFLLLSIGNLWVMKSFKHNNDHSKVTDIEQLEQDEMKINFTISLMVIFGILVSLVCLMILLAVFTPVFQSNQTIQPSETTNSESLESSLKLLIKEAYAEDISMVLTLAQAIMKRLDLPKVKIEPEYVLKNVLQPHAFFQASAFVRIFKLLLVYFIALANFNLWATIYWMFHYRAFVLNSIQDFIQNSEDEEIRQSMIPISAYGTPPTINHSLTHHIVSRNSINSRFGHFNQNHSNNNNLNRQIKIAKSSLEYDEVPEETINHTTGIIEVPFIGKSTDNLSRR